MVILILSFSVLTMTSIFQTVPCHYVFRAAKTVALAVFLTRAPAHLVGLIQIVPHRFANRPAEMVGIVPAQICAHALQIGLAQTAAFPCASKTAGMEVYALLRIRACALHNGAASIVGSQSATKGPLLPACCRIMMSTQTGRSIGANTFPAMSQYGVRIRMALTVHRKKRYLVPHSPFLVKSGGKFK